MNRFFITKEQIVLFLLSGAFALLVSNNVFHIQTALNSALPFFLAGVFGSILGFLLFRAGVIVIKSLVYVAAELSLIIFLAQAYCAPEVMRSFSSDSALSGLLVFGLGYVAYRFLSDAYKELIALIKKFKEVDKRWSWEVILMSVFLVIFVGLFIWSVYLVINPIVTNLCIYKK